MMSIVVFFTLLVTGIAIKDIANDSWVSSYFTKEDTKYGPAMESVSQLFGEFITGSLFLLINSKDFLSYIGLENPGDYFISYGNLFIFLGCAEIFTGLYILFLVPDNSSENDRKFSSVYEVYAIVPKLAKNKNIRKSMLFLGTCAIGNSIFGTLVLLACIDIVFSLSAFIVSLNLGFSSSSRESKSQ